MHNSEANDEQRLTRYGKRIRLTNVAQQLSKTYSSRRATSADNAVQQDFERFDLSFLHSLGKEVEGLNVEEELKKSGLK